MSVFNSFEYASIAGVLASFPLDKMPPGQPGKANLEVSSLLFLPQGKDKQFKIAIHFKKEKIFPFPGRTGDAGETENFLEKLVSICLPSWDTSLIPG